MVVWGEPVGYGGVSESGSWEAGKVDLACRSGKGVVGVDTDCGAHLLDLQHRGTSGQAGESCSSRERRKPDGEGRQ